VFVTFDDLLKFVESELRMSHVYQPLLISFLVDSGGAATVRKSLPLPTKRACFTMKNA
jgi:hypothetical protein